MLPEVSFWSQIYENKILTDLCILSSFKSESNDFNRYFVCMSIIVKNQEYITAESQNLVKFLNNVQDEPK